MSSEKEEINRKTFENYVDDLLFNFDTKQKEVIVLYHEKDKLRQRIPRNVLIKEAMNDFMVSFVSNNGESKDREKVIHEEKSKEKQFFLKMLNLYIDETFYLLFKGYKSYFLRYKEKENRYYLVHLGMETVEDRYIYKANIKIKDGFLKEIIFNNSDYLLEKEYVSRITFFMNGSIKSLEWKLDDKIHRKNKPAKITYYVEGTIREVFYYSYGKLHGTDFPAYVQYFMNGEKQCEKWYYQDVLHREGTEPAVTFYDLQGHTTYKYYEHGKEFTNLYFFGKWFSL